jgi:hypothetical protein
MTVNLAAQRRDLAPQDIDTPQPPVDDVERRIAHFIPPVELRGSRADKLRRLDTLIAYLEQLRRSLAGRAPAPHGFDRPGRYAGAPAWPWFVAGAAVSALLLLLVLLLLHT